MPSDFYGSTNCIDLNWLTLLADFENPEIWTNLEMAFMLVLETKQKINWSVDLTTQLFGIL